MGETPATQPQTAGAAGATGEAQAVEATGTTDPANAGPSAAGGPAGLGAGTAADWGEGGVPDPVELVLTFMRLSSKARHTGLLSLEEEAASLPGEALKEGIMEVVDGAPAEFIGRIMDDRIEELRARRQEELRRELLVMSLIKTGVLAVQRGHPPRLVRYLLDAQLSPQERARVRAMGASIGPTEGAARPPAGERPDTGVTATSQPAPAWAGVDPQQLTLDYVLELGDREMVQVVRELNARDLALALRNVSEPVRDRFFRAMSSRAASQMREDMYLMGPQRVSVIAAAQQRIVQLMRRLAETSRSDAATT